MATCRYQSIAGDAGLVRGRAPRGGGRAGVGSHSIGARRARRLIVSALIRTRSHGLLTEQRALHTCRSSAMMSPAPPPLAPGNATCAPFQVMHNTIFGRDLIAPYREGIADPTYLVALCCQGCLHMIADGCIGFVVYGSACYLKKGDRSDAHITIGQTSWILTAPPPPPPLAPVPPS